MIKSIAHVCIGATDLAATERFYCAALGFKKHFDFIRAGKLIGFYLEVAPNSYVEVFQDDAVDPNAKAPIRHICFQVDDVDAFIRRLKAQGCQVSDKKMGGDNSWQSWVTDPAGVRIEFHQYTPESCQFTKKNCILG